MLLSRKDNKKGEMNVSSIIYTLIGVLVVIVMIVAVAPTMFNGTSTITGAPGFFNTIFPILIAAALIFLVWRAVSAN
jgi:cytochrome c biogenesis factor